MIHISATERIYVLLPAAGSALLRLCRVLPTAHITTSDDLEAHLLRGIDIVRNKLAPHEFLANGMSTSFDRKRIGDVRANCISVTSLNIIAVFRKCTIVVSSHKMRERSDLKRQQWSKSPEHSPHHV